MHVIAPFSMSVPFTSINGDLLLPSKGKVRLAVIIFLPEFNHSTFVHENLGIGECLCAVPCMMGGSYFRFG